eukprot:GFYU01024507.1.p1 GENE.GFYU01024507.1~~GFYU01024507.1.p1  ORF type:complete len:138 (+),score=16.58 GFYU01024507.1:107-520(+)
MPRWEESRSFHDFDERSASSAGLNNPRGNGGGSGPPRGVGGSKPNAPRRPAVPNHVHNCLSLGFWTRWRILGGLYAVIGFTLYYTAWISSKSTGAWDAFVEFSGKRHLLSGVILLSAAGFLLGNHVTPKRDCNLKNR